MKRVGHLDASYLKGLPRLMCFCCITCLLAKRGVEQNQKFLIYLLLYIYSTNDVSTMLKNYVSFLMFLKSIGYTYPIHTMAITTMLGCGSSPQRPPTNFPASPSRAANRLGTSSYFGTSLNMFKWFCLYSMDDCILYGQLFIDFRGFFLYHKSRNPVFRERFLAQWVGRNPCCPWSDRRSSWWTWRSGDIRRHPAKVWKKHSRHGYKLRIFTHFTACNVCLIVKADRKS